MKVKPWLVGAVGIALSAGSMLPAAADPADPVLPAPVDIPAGLSGSAGQEGAQLSPSIRQATGNIAAFVEFADDSGLDVSAQGGSAADVKQQREEVKKTAAAVTKPGARRGAGVTAVAVTSDVVAGAVVTGDAAAIRDLASKPEVVAIYRLSTHVPMNKGNDTLTQALATWQNTGFTGKNVRVGVIDTGIDFTHADFGGPGTAEAYAEAYGKRGEQPVPAGTFDGAKYLGGWDFAGYGYNPDQPGAVAVPDDNPIDSNIGGGHGTHVAGTLGGYGVLEDGSTYRGAYKSLTSVDDFAIAPGSAPEVGLYALKVFGDLGGSTNLTVAALDWAADPNGDGNFSDHLDIVNLSLGSVSTAADDPENLFVDKLATVGTLAVISSGNSGDMHDVGGTPGNARAALTVANSIGSAQTYDAVKVLEPSDVAGSYPAQNSSFYTGGADVTAPVAFLGDRVDGCKALTPEQAAQVAGKIAYLYWDDSDATRACGSYARFTNAARAGAAGVILGSTLNVFTAGIAGNETIPGAQMTAKTTNALMPAIKAGTLVATVGPSLATTTFVQVPEVQDTLNSSSSRGVHGSLGVIKPDVAAPGTGISSANVGDGTKASVKSGTSMSAPLVAGIAALVKQSHPTWDPAQIKTGVMNTAAHDVRASNPDGAIYGPNRVGSGRVDALQAVTNTTLAYNSSDRSGVSVSFGVVPVGQDTVTTKQKITVHNTGSQAATFATAYQSATTVGKAKIGVSPATVKVAAGKTATVTVTLTADARSLRRDVDPTTAFNVEDPVDYIALLSGRVILTNTATKAELRVPVQAAPRPVSSMKAYSVDLNRGKGTIDLDGEHSRAAGWPSLVAPFELKAESPTLPKGAFPQAPPSVIGSGDIRAVGFASTALQQQALGKQPQDGHIGIGIAVDKPWASLGTNIIPAVAVDVNNDDVDDFSVEVQKLSSETDITVAVTYALHSGKLPNGTSYTAGRAVYIDYINGADPNTDTSVFDSTVVVIPIPIGFLGFKVGTTPNFTVTTYSGYAAENGYVVDTVPTFGANPFAPTYSFAGNNQLLYLDQHNKDIRVTSAAAPKKGALLLLHFHNKVDKRWQVVTVKSW